MPFMMSYSRSFNRSGSKMVLFFFNVLGQYGQFFRTSFDSIFPVIGCFFVEGSPMAEDFQFYLVSRYDVSYDYRSNLLHDGVFIPSSITNPQSFNITSDENEPFDLTCSRWNIHMWINRLGMMQSVLLIVWVVESCYSLSSFPINGSRMTRRFTVEDIRITLSPDGSTVLCLWCQWLSDYNHRYIFWWLLTISFSMVWDFRFLQCSINEIGFASTSFPDPVSVMDSTIQLLD